MAKYMILVNYTLDGVKGLKAEGGSARVAAATELIEGLGGKVESFYFAFGDTDAYIIADFPDNASVAAAGLTVGAGGGGTVRTVVLVTPAEADAEDDRDDGARGHTGAVRSAAPAGDVHPGHQVGQPGHERVAFG